jgi:hypothetical protein
MCRTRTASSASILVDGVLEDKVGMPSSARAKIFFAFSELAWYPFRFAQLWVVYCKPPFKNAACVVEYLGRYTHRVAISNSRILSMKDGNVTLKWRDYKDSSKSKLMTIAAEEFIPPSPS